jgi:hypothetical protein
MHNSPAFFFFFLDDAVGSFLFSFPELTFWSLFSFDSDSMGSIESASKDPASELALDDSAVLWVAFSLGGVERFISPSVGQSDFPIAFVCKERKKA